MVWYTYLAYIILMYLYWNINKSAKITECDFNFRFIFRKKLLKIACGVALHQKKNYTSNSYIRFCTKNFLNVFGLFQAKFMKMDNLNDKSRSATSQGPRSPLHQLRLLDMDENTCRTLHLYVGVCMCVGE